MLSPTNTKGSETDMLSGWVENTHRWGWMGIGCDWALFSEGQDIAPAEVAGYAIGAMFSFPNILTN